MPSRVKCLHALLAHTLTGLASPMPEGVSVIAKVLQVAVLTAVVLVVGHLMLRQRPANAPAHPNPDPQALG